MQKPVLLVMAAGMGSRYGGLKQLDPVGPHGELIIDYAIYDAHRAGFDTVIFIIKEEHEAQFRTAIGDRIAETMEVKYVFQRPDDLPEGYQVPEGRTKPWGTAQAVLAARHMVDGPFAVINADDYYGPQAFQVIYDYLSTTPDSEQYYEYAMVGYRLINTVTEHGSVARGICELNRQGFLTEINERTRIEMFGDSVAYTEDGVNWRRIYEDTPVSMNLWGFTKSYLEEAEAGFPAFLDKTLAENPLKGEYYLPTVVSSLLESGKARVKVLPSKQRWYGVTYQADKPAVVAALAQMHQNGTYPEILW